MYKTLVRLLATAFAIASLSAAAYAAGIPVGYISYDVTGANVAQFDIVNFTGANASTPPDTTFPVTTPLSLSDLSLTVNYIGGGSQVFGSSYFTLDADGLSFDGEQLSTLSGPPTGLFNATSAVLTGMFSTQNLTLNNGSTAVVYPGFSATISDPSGLADGDLAVIDATTAPEPASWAMLGIGLLLMGLWRTDHLRFLAKTGNFIALSFGLTSLLLPAALKAETTVNLSAVTSPSSGSSGTSTVSVNGTGFPSGTISPANVLVSLSTTCGGSPTTATVSSVKNILGTSDRIAFVIPGSLAAGTYYVSVSGISASEVSFISGSSCSTVQVLPGPSPTLTINTSNPVDWVISNGALTIDYNSTEGNIWSIVPVGTQDQLIDFSHPDATDGESTNTGTFNSGSPLSGIPLPTGWASANPVGTGQPTTLPATNEPTGFYSILAGFGAVTPTPGYSLTSGYLDWWATFPSGSGNNFTYSEHFVVTPNDTGIHIYFVVNHAATDNSGSMGQIQWVVRDSVTQFTNTYAADADLSMTNPVITPLPSVDDMFSSDKGREVQDASGLSTIDFHPQMGVTNAFSPYPLGQIPAGYTRNFYVKYDYASYEYLHKAQGLFGSTYGIWAVFPAGEDTFIGGPQKQNLNFTSNLLTIEPLSDHFTEGITLNSSGPGSTTIPKGTAASRLFGPIYVRINKFGGAIQTPDDMYRDAVAAGASFTNFYNNETTLLANGYVPTTARGSVSVQVTGVAGAPKTAWAVLSQPGVNHQLSTQGYEYWQDISSTDSTTFTNVVPGTYRLSVYDLGRWGEYRNDSIVVTANQTTTVPPVTFVPENFGTTVWTIGTPDRSWHEFLHGHNTVDNPDRPLGYDDREEWGNWNYWADFAATNGAVIYNATDGPNGPATNDLSKWNYTHWASFDPGLYGGAYNSSDDTTDGYNYAIPAYVNALSGHTGTNGVGTPVPPWQIHFATPDNASSQTYAVLSLALAAAQSNYTITINGGNSLTWSNSKIHASDASERSGLSGFTEWVAFQWPTSVLNPAGQDNVIAISVAGTSNGYYEGSGSNAKAKVVANNSDDALRFELTNTGAAPSVTGWNDYEYVTSGTDTAANDAVANP